MDYWIFTCSKKRLEGTKFETLRKKNELSCWIQLIEPQSMEWEFRELTTSPEVLMRGIFCKKKNRQKFCPLHRSKVSSSQKYFSPHCVLGSTIYSAKSKDRWSTFARTLYILLVLGAM